MARGKSPSNWSAPRWEGDSRPDFAPGNLAAVRHGAYSERLLADTMEELRPELLRRAPWLGDELFRADVELYIRSAAIERRLSEWILRTMEEAGVDAVPSRQLEMRAQHARLVMQHGEKLGLTGRGYVEMRALIADTGRSEGLLASLELARAKREEARASRATREPSDAVE